ncbi:DUF1963 domain-containing protein [Novosphingobium sp. P6W]|uniref:DUF1963 domain-containing protein n=1 Tax=Novosphingobium sp. P6W TaxID=1609758 RepID=UPI0005C2AFA4|nr:DUF1963 domain-containing protein [Novosphingobium sp. P6W]KIS32949.1 hypothetical protein TQ38_05540 [Novosphingobium sp. P6W]
MKRLIAVMACFTMPAAVAFYVALAPFGGALSPLDAGAERISAALGQSNVIPALLVLGLVLALVAAFALRRREDHTGGEGEPGAPPAWTPEPLPTSGNLATAPEPEAHPDARIANLRRRAFSGSQAPAEAAPLPEAPAPFPVSPFPASPFPEQAQALPAPVILVRKPRERTRDWFADSSWLGGLPRLGGMAWPRGTDGLPLPFIAQIDLVELAFACPDTPLPRTGSLAFFLGAGAVVPVPEGAHDFTDPPHDLAPAFEEGGYPFPATVNRLTRWFFPFWPVQLLALDLPETLRDYHDTLREAAIEQAMAVQLDRHAPLRDHPFYAAGVGAPVEALWWHSVIHLADQLHEALAACARPLAAHRAALDQKRAAFEQLRRDPQAGPDALEHAQEAADYLADELGAMEEQSAALPEMVEALDQFVAGRDPWQQLEPAELDIVADILAEVHERFGELVRYHAPGSLAQLATLSLRAMVSGPPETFAALPDDVLARINRDYRLPPVDQHQMFGLPASRLGARSHPRSDLLLLQLGYDDMMEWCWSEAGLYQFWISAEDAAAGNWNAATLTFESD